MLLVYFKHNKFQSFIRCARACVVCQTIRRTLLDCSPISSLSLSFSHFGWFVCSLFRFAFSVAWNDVGACVVERSAQHTHVYSSFLPSQSYPLYYSSRAPVRASSLSCSISNPFTSRRVALLDARLCMVCCFKLRCSSSKSPRAYLPCESDYWSYEIWILDVDFVRVCVYASADNSTCTTSRR